MKWIKNILREVLGLFVDDGSFALAILIWLCVIGLLATHGILASAVAGIVLFAGLALILVESSLRYARRERAATKK